MHPRLSHFFGSLLALFFSVIAAFFGVMNILFTDIFGLDQRFESYLFVFLLYGVFGLLLTLIWPRQWRVWMWWLCAPAAVVGLLMGLLEPQQLIVTLGAVSFAILGAWGGATLARKVRKKMTQRPSH